MKKITVIIPNETYNILKNYCFRYSFNRLYFKDVINLAIKDFCRKNTANS